MHRYHTAGYPYPLQTTPILVGNLNDLNETYKGLIDELRISNIARYTGSTYTVPASKFTPDANTVGLWHFDEGTGNVSYEASSSNKNAVLYNGVTWAQGYQFQTINKVQQRA